MVPSRLAAFAVLSLWTLTRLWSLDPEAQPKAKAVTKRAAKRKGPLPGRAEQEAESGQAGSDGVRVFGPQKDAAPR